MPSAVQDLVSGRYRLLREIGAGGMGTVWEAEDETLGRRVAIKTIIDRLARDERALARFEREAKAVAQLRSAHIVQLLDYGIDQGVPYMVMELLEGASLYDRLQHQPSFPLQMAAKMVAQISKALTTAHASGIVHRDLKPENVYLVRDDEDEYLKVFDFGTAKALTGFKDAKDLTTLGSILGTPDYMAPEQLSGDVDTDARVDVWSLAVIAYHLITGALPYPGDGMGEVIHGIIFKDHVPPSDHDPSLPHDLDMFFEQALAKDREARFQSARALAGALAEIASIRPSLTVTLDGGSVREVVAQRDRDRALTDIEQSVLGRSSAATARALAPEDQALGSPELRGAAPRDEAADARREESSSSSHASSLSIDRARARAPWHSIPRTALALGAAAALSVGGVAAWLTFDPRRTEPEPPSGSDLVSGVEPGVTLTPAKAAEPAASPGMARPPSSGTHAPGSPPTEASATTSAIPPPSGTTAPSAKKPGGKRDIYEGLD